MPDTSSISAFSISAGNQKENLFFTLIVILNFYIKKEWAKTNKGFTVPGVSAWQSGATFSQYIGYSFKASVDVKYQSSFYIASDWLNAFNKMKPSFNLLATINWNNQLGELRFQVEHCWAGDKYSQVFMLGEERWAYPKEKTKLQIRWLKTW